MRMTLSAFCASVNGAKIVRLKIATRIVLRNFAG
jgi:hypothetical protein